MEQPTIGDAASDQRRVVVLVAGGVFVGALAVLAIDLVHASPYFALLAPVLVGASLLLSIREPSLGSDQNAGAEVPRPRMQEIRHLVVVRVAVQFALDPKSPIEDKTRELIRELAEFKRRPHGRQVGSSRTWEAAELPPKTRDYLDGQPLASFSALDEILDEVTQP